MYLNQITTKKRKRATGETQAKNDDELETFLFGATTFEETNAVAKPAQMIGESDDEVNSDDEELEVSVSEEQPAWEDDDDVVVEKSKKFKAISGPVGMSSLDSTVIILLEGEEFEKKLRSERTKSNPQQLKWAQKYASTTTILQSTNALIAKTAALDKGALAHCPLPYQISQKLGLQHSVQFHHGGDVMLTAGYDGRLRLFEINHQQNKCLQDVRFAKFPTRDAKFTPAGGEVIVTGYSKDFFSYDLEVGKINAIKTLTTPQFESQACPLHEISPDNKYIAIQDENLSIYLLSAKTKAWIHTFYSNEVLKSISFSHDSQSLFSTGEGGKIYEWDLKQRRCRRTFLDPGLETNTCIANSPKGIYQAIGTSSGFLNIYDYTKLNQDSPKPLQSIGRITTPVLGIKFNHDSQIVAYWDETNIKLVHLPSCTVFSNFLHSSVSTLAFSPNSSCLVMAKQNGAVTMHQLSHYAKA